MIRKIGVLTSGGDAPGMNAAVRAVTRAAISNGIEVVGIKDGYYGLLHENFVNLTRRDVSGIMDRGGTFLGTARLPEFKEDEVQNKAVKILQDNQIDCLVTIGGDGTYHGAVALTEKGINCIGIPATIDNDINGTDTTIGFSTSLNCIAECIDRLRDTSDSHHRCMVVEVMGNHCGDLGVYSALATGAEVIAIPEFGYNEEEVIQKCVNFDKMGKRFCIVVVTEKLVNANELAKKIGEVTTFESRAVVLGHIQRGGKPTVEDRILATRMGEKAVSLLVSGIGGECVISKEGKITHMPINEALTNKHISACEEIYNIFDSLV